jgi:hypothetical protein
MLRIRRGHGLIPNYMGSLASSDPGGSRNVKSHVDHDLLNQAPQRCGESDVLRKECEDMLATLWQPTHMVFSERLAELRPGQLQ